MKKKVIISILSAIILSEIICIAGLCMCQGRDENSHGITIREIPQQTVLYSIHRCRYYKISDAINELYTLAQSKGILTCGPVSICCLNSSLYENDNHRLIEIQVPVESVAIDLAGTLGEMTDVKVLPAMKVAVAVKPEGDNDPTAVIANLLTWINKKGYVVRGRMRQTVLNGGKGSYYKLKTEFMVPIDQLTGKDCPTLTMDLCYM